MSDNTTSPSPIFNASSRQATEVPDEDFKMLARLRLARITASRAQPPVLQPEALEGLAGDIVKALTPLTEATPAAMLTTILSAFGAMCGRNAHTLVGSKPHYPNIFVVVVGDTAKARKGTSAAAVRPPLKYADDPSNPFFPTRELAGIQSGEALIRAVAQSGDPTAQRPDQRILVYEEEYGRLLTVASRRDATLSATLRTAWDGEEMTRHTVKETLQATHPHVGVIAHVTQGELVRKMTADDSSNGYANRFLHVWSQRTSVHPVPGQLRDEVVKDFGDQLARSIGFAQSAGLVRRSAEFAEAWDAAYRIIEHMPSGGHLFDSLTARGTAHVLRLSLLYALLDESDMLEARHLRSAMALWEYCEATVAHVWDASLGDARQDKFYAALMAAGDAGLDRTQASSVFSNNLSGEQLNTLTDQLIGLGLARVEQQSTGGRPRTVLLAAR